MQTESKTGIARLSAAARTRRVRKVVGPGPAITSTPAGNAACVTTVFTSRADEVAKQLHDALGLTVVGKPGAGNGFVMLSWPEDGGAA